MIPFVQEVHWEELLSCSRCRPHSQSLVPLSYSKGREVERGSGNDSEIDDNVEQWELLDSVVLRFLLCIETEISTGQDFGVTCFTIQYIPKLRVSSLMKAFL